MSSFDCPARGQRGRVPRRRGARPPSPLATACVPPRRRSTMRSFEGAGPPPLQRDHRRQGFSVARRSETRSPRPRCRRRRRPRRAGGDRSAGRRLWRRRGVGDDGPKGDEALGSAVMRGRFAGRRKERARRWRDRDRATGRPKASRVRPCAAGRGGGRRGETMSRRRGDAGRRMSEAEMVCVMVEIPGEIRGIRAVPEIFPLPPFFQGNHGEHSLGRPLTCQRPLAGRPPATTE